MTRDVKQGLVQPNFPTQVAPNGWVVAAGLVERWLAKSERVDALLEGLPASLPPQERARAQHLFYGVVRWTTRLEAAWEGLMAQPPRTKVKAVLLLAGFEILESGPQVVAQVVHHAVEQAKSLASPKEARLVNAVARKMAARLAETPSDPATEFAHPAWLLARWTAQFGPEIVRQLLQWNQQAAPIYARWRTTDAPPAFLAPTRWENFYEVKAGHWDEVRQLARQGALYLQDPSTRISVDLLAPQSGETVLDACAAPGGKSLLIADRIRTGRLVAVDLPPAPGKSDLRIVRLKENLARAPSTVTVALVEADVLKVGTQFYRNLNLPESYDTVLLDAPCSNTGVMRHRIDVKWRLQDGDFARHAEQQTGLLHACARLVHPGGRLVYSTCSIDAEENEKVVKAFLATRAGGRWQLARSIISYPWVDGHDGGAAFLFTERGG